MKQIRVYHPNGDFIVDVPDDVKCTFGYFNPASPRFEGDRGPRDQFGNPNIARQSALRIYAGKVTDKNQIAVFLGVTGYRFEELTVTKLEEAVTIIQSFTDDPASGVTESSRKQSRQLMAIPERGQIS